MNNYGTHFPNNRDGGVSGPGRTKARFLQSELPGLPFASARRKSADGMTEITARKRGDGFTEVRLQQQEAEWTQDAWVVNTRDWFDKDTLRTHSRLKSRKPKPGSSETPMWRAWQNLPQPLGMLDPAATVQRGGVFSMGGNGRVFVSAPVAKSYVYDAWEWRFLNLGGVYNLAHARAKAREQAALAPPGYHGTACVERAHGIWVGAPGGAMRKVGQVQVASFSAFDTDGGHNGYRGLGLPTLFEGMRFQNELVGTVAFVDGARWRGRYESAVAYSAINEQGWHVARVRVFDANGWHIEADVAAGAVFRCTAVEAGAAVSASKLAINLNGEKSVADVAALYFVDGERRADLNYIIRQKAPETDATMLVSGALSDRAEKIFRGTLDFVSGSPGSVGRESEEVMLLSPQVRNRSVPLMLSGEADVDGHHAVTIGKMDENKLFYLMSRGLDDEAAKKLVVEAAVAPVLARLPDETLAREIRDEIERRLSHA